MKTLLREILSQAEAQLRSGQADEAVKLCKKGLSLDYQNVDFCSLLGMIESQRGHHSRAKTLFLRVQRANPRDHKNLNNLGNALAQLNELQKAEAQLRAAIEIEPDFAAAHNNLGSVLIRQRRNEEAIKALNKAVEIDSSYQEAIFNLGLALEMQGELELAQEKYSAAMMFVGAGAAAAEKRHHEVSIRLSKGLED